FYDFQPIFVVGGGTAGCVMARKLSDSGEHSVLVLEAGILPDPGLDVPALASSFLSNSNYTRTYYSVPQQNADLENDNDIQGRENAGRTETYNGVFPATDQHGYDGPINVSLPKYVPLLNEWLSAGQFLGYPISDPNGPQQISFCPSEYSKRRGRRVSSYAGYLKPVLGQRKNLKVILKAEARRIIFNGNQAIGVQFRSTTDGFPTDNVVFARNEIIKSAGAVETPALLMKSGIGPTQVLNAASVLDPIRPVKCLPVGQNLQESAAFIEERDLNLQTFRYLNEVGDGPYAAYSGFGGQAFISTTAQGNQTKVRDIQLFHFVAPCVPYCIQIDQIFKQLLGKWQPLHLFSSLMFSGMEITMKIFENTPQFKKLGARFPPNQFPDCERLQFRSRRYWECHAKQSATSFMHASGTCHMRSGEQDPSAVVITD
ncbi:Oxygen-dependent choline dehydrogenase, partial [Orchesella cincta]